MEHTAETTCENCFVYVKCLSSDACNRSNVVGCTDWTAKPSVHIVVAMFLTCFVVYLSTRTEKVGCFESRPVVVWFQCRASSRRLIGTIYEPVRCWNKLYYTRFGAYTKVARNQRLSDSFLASAFRDKRWALGPITDWSFDWVAGKLLKNLKIVPPPREPQATSLFEGHFAHRDPTNPAARSLHASHGLKAAQAWLKDSKLQKLICEVAAFAFRTASPSCLVTH